MSRTFETGLEKLGRIIASQYNINVVFRGSGASTDGQTIFLPSTDTLTPELMTDLQGFLDHEVAHCRFTDFDSLKNMLVAGRAFQKNLLNACEDSRIERLMIADLPGCRFNLEPLNAKYGSLMREKLPTLEWPIRLIVAIRDVMDGVPPTLDAEIQPMFDEIESDIPAFNLATSTIQVRDNAAVITKKILKYLEEEKEEKKEEEKSESGEPESGESGESESEKSESEKSESEKSESGESGESGESESEKSESGESGESESGESEPSKSGESMLSDEEAKGWEAAPMTVDDMVRGELEKHFQTEAKTASESSEYRPYTTEFDTVKELTGTGDHAEYMKMRKEVRSMVGTVKSKLEQLLKVKENAKMLQNREAGYINPRSLGRMVTDRNFRTPFNERVKTETNNVAVEILVDLSGSMRDRMATTRLAVTALAEALQGLGISFEVTGFNSIARRRSGEKPFNRLGEALEHKVFKSWDSDNLSAIQLMREGHNNTDGESVKWAANRLSLRSQKRKIMIVFSDGDPCAQDSIKILRGHLKTVVAKVLKSGIELIGIGIQSSAVREYYPNYTVINKIDELPIKAMSELSKILLKG